MTPLHMAVKQTSAEYPIEHVKVLPGRQTAAANANSRDINMQTPLHYAVEYCSDHPRVTELLLDRYVTQLLFKRFTYCYTAVILSVPYAVVQRLMYKMKMVSHLSC